jgi:hypothetical protein
VVNATAFPAVHSSVPCLPRYRGEGIVKDHHQIFFTQRLAAVMTYRGETLALIVALGAFPAQYRVTQSH